MINSTKIKRLPEFLKITKPHYFYISKDMLLKDFSLTVVNEIGLNDSLIPCFYSKEGNPLYPNSTYYSKKISELFTNKETYICKFTGKKIKKYIKL